MGIFTTAIDLNIPVVVNIIDNKLKNDLSDNNNGYRLHYIKRINLFTNDINKLTDEDLITATMAQSGFAKQSEQFAALVQEEMNKRVQSKNRGVKQAGFYVLMGASMPNVLIELGFLSNPNEEKKLNSSSYRDMLATSIYYAILKYQKTLND